MHIRLDLWYFAGDASRNFVGTVLKTLGCAACDDLAVDGSVTDEFTASLGNISRPGVKMTVVMSRSDTLVPVETSIVDEAGVRNIYVQDYCAEDKVGHAGLAWDRNVWSIIKNELSETYDAKFTCETDHILTV